MTETDQQRDGRVLAEAVLFNLTLDLEAELGRVYGYRDEILIATHKARLEPKLKNAKDALEWAKSMSVI